MPNFFNKYPYTDFHELNLDYVLASLKLMQEKIDNFIQADQIRYANPIEWNITSQYEANTIVIDPVTKMGYMSLQAVPTGISINNNNYWQEVFDFGPFYNIVTMPELYGAKGDGITDDTAAIQNCFDNAVGRIIIMNNKYVVSDTVNAPDNCIIICNGEIIHNLNGTEKAVIELGNNCEWHNGTFTGAGYGTSYNSVRSVMYINDKNNVLVSNTTFTDVPYVYTVCIENSAKICVRNCIIRDYTYGGICILNGGNDIDILYNSVIDGHETAHANRYPVSTSLYDGYGAYVPVSNVKVVGNYIKDSTNYWEGIDAHGGHNLLISGNTIIGTNQGIAISGDDGGNYTVDNVTISDNQIILPDTGTTSSNQNTGVTCTRGTNYKISGNYIKNSGKVCTSNTAGHSMNIGIASNVTVNDNTITDCNFGGFMITGVENLSIQNNNVSTTTANTVEFARFSTPSNKVYVTNNIINGFPYLARSVTGADGSYRIYFKDNITTTYGLINQEYTIVDHMTSAALNNLKIGAVGDIIYNSSPSAGNPIGWVCTSAGTDLTPATWTALSNL